MVDGASVRTTFSATEVEEIRQLLDELPEARLAIRRMNLARMRHMGLGIATQPESQPSRDEFEELLSSELLTTNAPWMNTQALARSTGYAKRNVHEALTSLSAAEVISSFTVNGEQRYIPDRSIWATLLRREPDDLPAHRDWQQLLAILGHILRWSEQPELGALSDYLVASSARDLLESLRSDLAFVGIPLSPGSTPQDTWRELQAVTERALNAITG